MCAGTASGYVRGLPMVCVRGLPMACVRGLPMAMCGDCQWLVCGDCQWLVCGDCQWRVCGGCHRQVFAAGARIPARNSRSFRLNSFNNDNMGPFPVLIISSLFYVVFFGITFSVIFFRHYRSTFDFSEFVCGWPGVKLAVIIGFCDAINGVLVVNGSPPDRVPPILQTILAGASVIFGVLLKDWRVSERG